MAVHDLSRLRRMVEADMVDACTITRDTPGTDDDTLDRVTGALVPPGGDAPAIYTGKCMRYPTGLRAATASEGERPYTEKSYTLRIPWNATEPKVGDVVTMTASLRDPGLVGRQSVVQEVIYSTYLVSRDMVVEDRE